MTDQSAASEQLRHVARGAALGLAGSAFAAVTGFGLAVAVTRGLSATDAGRFFAVTSVLGLLVAASTFGTEAGLARFLLRLAATGRTREVQHAVLWAVLPTVAMAVLWAGALGGHRDTVAGWLGLGASGATVLLWVAWAIPAAVAADVLLASTRGFGRIGPTVLVDRILRSGLQICLAVLVLAAGGGLLTVTIGWAGAYLVSAVLALVVSVRAVRRGSRVVAGLDDRARTADADQRPIGARFWSFTAPRGVGSLAQMGIQKADIVLVAVLLTPLDAALYAAATRFVPVGQMAVQALQQVLQPRFTAILVLDDEHTLAEVFRVTTIWSILLAWPLYLVVGGAPTAYLALFGAPYADAAAVVVVMSAAMLVAVATGPVDTLLVMAGRSGLSMANALAALGLDLVLCFVLVPRWGITGAAVAWAAAVVTRCALATWQVHSELAVSPGRQVALAAALPTACFVPVPVLGVLGAGDVTWAWAFAVGAGLLLYGAGLARWRGPLALDLLVRSRRPGPTPAVLLPTSVVDHTT